MNLLKIITVVGFGMMLINCGGQDNKTSQETVEVDRVEDGVAKAKDGRIILSSESESYLVIPDGEFKGFELSATRVADSIKTKVKSVSEVYDLSLSSKFFPFWTDEFITSFSVSTNLGDIYQDVQCISYVIFGSNMTPRLILRECENDQVAFAENLIRISMKDIVVNQQKLDAKKRERLGL